ncbi:hypothetical protein BEL04_08640 [Mucilaginibacter sp. PPCGB 2223]|uniref:hypothetical protein n=1 Tax=Mucilaginibacter sp. PPCGB 2223 TaxID=1886027 RepID=UPI0008263176|nr:hypothetical protein [Mucilaginibacter sp. PPCGB 2223]OCX54316.1 hypothetical protein BEL04_08640 [Mucilaginibacter sp. PPCGB 2223]
MNQPDETEYTKLKNEFVQQHKNWKDFLPLLKQPGDYRSVKTLEADINRLNDFIVIFSGLCYAISIQAAVEDPKGHRRETLNLVNNVKDKVIYQHLSPLTNRLNHLVNRANMIVAYVALFVGLLGVGLAVYPLLNDPVPHLLKKLDEIEHKIDSINTSAGKIKLLPITPIEQVDTTNHIKHKEDGIKAQ